MKDNLLKVIEPDEGEVHFAPPFGLDQVTLCGITDWLDVTPGEYTEKPVTCIHCKRLVAHIHAHRKPRNADKWHI